jgi:L-ascorbate metabolism protein UlaG (beta-lactamase superfamily)
MFAVPAATPDTGLSATWLGVSTLLLDDGQSAIMTDGFFSRPPLARVVLGTVSPSTARVSGCLTRAGVRKLAAVLPVHTHYDHVLDSAVVAEQTGAQLIGGVSAANVGRGHGLPDDQIVVASPGQPIEVGPWEVTLIESRHCPPDRFPGVITEPVRPPVKASAYKCGEAWSTLIHHGPTGRRCLIQGSAGFLPGVLPAQRAQVAYLGLGQLGLQSRDYIVDYWANTVRAVGARTVIAIHWDDFFRPLSKPLRALPFAGDDLDFSLRVLGELAERDGVALLLPRVWRREDPWALVTREG